MNQNSARYRFHAIFALLLICAVTLLVYYPGLRGPFVFDDAVNIVDNPHLALKQLNTETLLGAAFSSNSGILKRPLAMASFALNYYFADGFSDTLPFKLTNLIIHLINACLLYWLVSLLLTTQRNLIGPVNERRDRWLPGIIAAIWALHPIQLTSVLYVVQRMTSMSAILVLTGLIIYLHGRQRLVDRRAHAYPLMALGLLTGFALGSASKENALLTPLFALLIEFVFCDRHQLDSAERNKLWWFYSLWILAPAIAVVSWLTIHPNFLAATYAAREFTLWQRILTEPRILWYYVGLFVVPNIRELTLFHDDIVISTGLLTPWTTLPALFGLVAVLVVALRSRSKYPVFCFAVLWFLVAHSLESGIIGLELAHEHRNYLPSIGLSIGIVYALHTGLAHKISRQASLSGLVVLAIAFATITYLRAQSWRSEKELIQSMVENHPGSARSQGMLAELYARRFGNIEKSLANYQVASALAPWETSYPIRMAMIMAQAAQKNPDSLPAGLVLKNDEVERIANQLAEKPLTPSTVADLRSLAICIPRRIDPCAPLYGNAIAWYKAAIRNTYVGNELRKTLIIYLFNIGVWHKDYAVSLEAASAGMQYYPGETDFMLMQANVYILVDRLEEAQKIITSVRQTLLNQPSELSDKADALQSMLQRHLNETPP